MHTHHMRWKHISKTHFHTEIVIYRIDAKKIAILVERKLQIVRNQSKHVSSMDV